MKVKRIIVAVLVILLAGTFGHVYGKDTAKAKSDEKAQAKSMVEKAVAFVKANGKEKAITEFNKPDGKFVKDSLYVFAYDLNGTVIAHPKLPELIGKNLINKPDSRGKLFRKEIVEKAKSKGKGWVNYRYLNPTIKKEEAKTTYFKKAGDMIICCGVYY
ncbi:MAG: cache type 2 domain-containing protein [Deltaproteobacteria bacterium RBG_19FT_COMBO_43_11]|nr:MAG: cache type 2 domain-containing protein [Deltaproteobacteria bacterium RBG_19FT_COMBO_43_11]